MTGAERVAYNVSEMVIPSAIIYPIILSRAKQKYNLYQKTLTQFIGYFIAVTLSAIPNIADKRHGLNTDFSVGDNLLIIVYPVIASWLVVQVFRYKQENWR